MKQIQFSMPSGSKQSESGNDASIIDGGRNSSGTSSKLSLLGPRLVPPTSSAPSFWLSTVAIMQGNKPIAVVDKTLAG